MASIEHNGVIKISSKVSTAYTQISCNSEFISLPVTTNEIGVWRLEEINKRPVHIRSHLTQISAFCFGHQSNPTYLCTASEDSIYLWQTEQAVIDYKTGQFTEGLQVAKELGHCNHLCFSHDDNFLSACIQKEVWIINLETLELVATLTGHTGNATGSIFCPHHMSTFVTISEDRSFKIWDIENAMLLYQSPIISASPFWSIAMHPEHMHFAIGSGDGKIRVFDLVSHRCLHETDIPNSVAKFDFSRENSTLSSESDKTISSLPTWKQGHKQQKYGNHEYCNNGNDGSGDDTEHSVTVLSLAYWKENLTVKESFNGRPEPSSTNYDNTVREVLKDPPFLIAGCTSLVVLFDANTMDVVFHLNLMEPLVCHKALEPVEYCIASAGCFAFATSEDTCRIHCLVGSLFESNVHVLTIQPDRTSHVNSDSSEISDESLVSKGGSLQPADAVPSQLSVLSSVPVMKGSPLLAILEPKQPQLKTNKGKKATGSKMNQPLTFQARVKSSGYSEKPRQAMFRPKTNTSSSNNNSLRKRPSTLVKEKAGISTKLSSDSYPIKSEPPVQLKEKFRLPPKPTAINSIQFSVDGKQISCALGDKNAFIFKLPYVGKVSSFVGHNNVINSATLSHDNSWLLTSSDDRTAKLWTPNNTSPLLNFSNIKHNFNAEKVTPSMEQENPVFPKEITKASFYYVDKFILLSCLNTLYMFKYTIGETKQDIKRYQTSNKYKLVRKFEIDDVQHITTFSCINGFFSYIVLAACSDKSVAIFDMNVGTVVRRMKDVHIRSVHSISQNQGSPYVTHPSEAYDLFLTSAATDGIKLWDLRADRCVRKYDGHVNRSQTVGVSYSPCSRFIATGSEDRSAYVYDIRNSAYLHRLSGQSDVVSCVDFHPQTPMLATATLDGEMRFYQDI